ncbi:MAG: hypothetical protein KF773_06590 [Deltaproteobacteria bacterium]|nr:hypothetical protein [Deltaproteobacteria bacterium]MCW5803343.1 hypothetical protein [Deltaproteobacteria bacterium]
MMTTTHFDSISTDSLSTITGGADKKPSFWSDLADAGAGAANMVANPFGAAYRFGKGLGGARAAGHSWGDSVANGLVQSAQTMTAPNLADIKKK